EYHAGTGYAGYFFPFPGFRPHRKEPDSTYIETEVHQPEVGIERKSQSNQSVVGFTIKANQQRDGNEFGQGVEYFRQNTPRSSRKYPFGIHIQPTNIRKNADWPKRTAIRSEERRVGKESRTKLLPFDSNKVISGTKCYD